MKTTAATLVRKALEDEDIPFTFGIPGTHNIELYDTLSESKKTQPILVTDEQSASFMADAVWRSSGRLGCVNLVPGAGLTHALSGIAEAYLDHIPLLVLACGIRRDTPHSFQLHDINQQKLVAPVTKQSFQIEKMAEVYATLRKACHLARSGVPGPVMVEIPANFYMVAENISEELTFEEPINSSPSISPTPIDESQLALIVKELQESKQPVLYLGLGSQPAGANLISLAEKLEAPVCTTIQGKGVFPESHPLFLWNGLGKSMPSALKKILESCETMLALGCRFGEVATASYGFTPPEKLIHIDIDPLVFNKNYQANLSMAIDSGVFLDHLLPKLEKRSLNAPLRSCITKERERIRLNWHQNTSKHGVTPFRLLSEIQATFGPETLYTVDSGNGMFLAMEMLCLDKPQNFLGPVDFSCMGYAIPAAIGAKLASPEKPVVSLVGDGAFLMTGLELITAKNQNLDILFVILNDQELSQIAQFQKAVLNQKTCTELAPVNFLKICEGLDIPCTECKRDEDIQLILEQFDRAKKAGPQVINCKIDYTEKTFFTKGVLKTNFGRLSWSDRFRFINRAVYRKLTEPFS